MKVRVKKYIYSLFTALIAIACSSEDFTVWEDSPGEEITVYLHVTTPAGSLPGGNNTRAWNTTNETLLETIDVLIFEVVNDVYEFQYRISGQSLSSTGTNTYIFHARIPANENPLKFYLLANSSENILNLSVGDTEETVKTKIIETYPPTGLADNLPMFGEVEFLSGLTTDEEQIEVDLLRSVARVDVINNASADFTLTSVQFYRANSLIQVIPAVIENGRVTLPTIPPGSTNTVNTDALYINGTSSQAELYLPESAVTDESDRRLQATCVVVGGVYGTDTDTTYYRMDFVPENSPELFGQVLRNHRYIFNINGVEGRGWLTPDEAATNNSSQFEVEIIEWDDSTTDMVFDGQNYFGVSSRIITLKYEDGATESISVDTDLSSYVLYWLTDEGNIDTSVAPITYGETFTDRQGLFKVSVSDNGTAIRATALSINRTTEVRTKTLLARAGRLELTILINQNGLILTVGTRKVSFYGSTTQIGTFGGGLLSNVNADRPAAMVNMMNNLNNFGPEGQVRFGGWIIAGLSEYQISADLAELFDVIYLTYAGTPNATTVQNVFNWLDASNNRVLIVQYDGTNTNQNVFSYLGFSFTQRAIQTAYTLSPDAPSEIVNGPFGTLPPDMTFRCYDTTHGEIELAVAAQNNITPILIGGAGGMVLGVDFSRHIVYCGDIDLYYFDGGGITANGTVSSNQDILMANLFAWIATTVLTEM